MTKAAGQDWVDASADARQTDIGHPAVSIGRDGRSWWPTDAPPTARLAWSAVRSVRRR